VANDGPHVYNEQAIVHQELLALFRHGEDQTGPRRPKPSPEQRSTSLRGALNLTVVQNYYAIIAAQRKIRQYANERTRG